MLITSSRALTTKCWRKTFNTYHRNLVGDTALALIDGGSTHKAIAHGLATKDWDAALAIARIDHKERMADSYIPPEQSYLGEDHWQLTKAMVEKAREGLEKEGYEVIQPECTFNIELPDSGHNCIMLHWFNHYDGKECWGQPPANLILKKMVSSPHHPDGDRGCLCWQPHRLVGQTDALVMWERNLWLLEHKTTSSTGDIFWAQWEIDLQPTIYLYGIWKSLGILPRGVVFNAITKPSEKQVSKWNAGRLERGEALRPESDYISYERHVITRTTEDVSRIEWVLRDLCNEWEHRIVTGDFRPALMRTVCIDYNRRCEYFTPCMAHETEGSFDGLRPRQPRYDDEAWAQLVTTILPTTTTKGE